MPNWSPRGPLLFVDGRQQRSTAVAVEWDDPGLGQGFGAFETLAVYDGIPAELDAHLDRLLASCAALRLPTPDRGTLEFQVQVALGAWGAAEGVIRLQCTAGERVILAVRPLPERRRRVSAATCTWPSPPFPPASAKHTSRAGARLAPLQLDVDEVFRLDPQGRVLEGTWSNVFCLAGGVLHTAPATGDILPGVTRGLLLELLRSPRALSAAPRLEVVERAPPAHTPAEAWFVTSSLHGVVPVDTLDGRPLPPLPDAVARLRDRLDRAVGRPPLQP